MAPDEVRRARLLLGMSHEQIAATLSVSEGEVRLWEQRPGVIPRRHAERLTWLAAAKERENALAAAGIPECEWVRAWQSDPVPEKPGQQVRHFEILRSHARSCGACRARERYAEEHLPPLPYPPASGWMGALARFIEAVDLLPRWARPAAYGAAAVGTMTLLRVVLGMFADGPSPALLRMAALGVLLGGYLGAVGGLTYHAVRDPFRRFGRAGAYLTGIVVVAASLLAFGIPDLVLSDDPMLGDPVVQVSCAIGSIVYGLAIGHWWFRDP